MSKAYKPISSKYIKTTGIVHNRTALNSYLDTLNSSVSTNTTNIEVIGQTKYTSEVTKSATQSQSNTINSISLGVGIWIVWGWWVFEGSTVSSWTGFNNSVNGAPVSCYDDQGWVNMTISDIAVVNSGTKTISLTLWPRNKTISVKSKMWAVRIK